MEATCIRKVAAVLAVLSSFFNINSSAQVPAFPGADGYGRYTQGGRGSTVYYVTTLDDSDEQGTLRYGVTRLSKAVIMFKMSGTIHLNSPLNISASNITIAGQSAPGDGICIADYPVSVSGNQVIIRYMRFRMGDRKLSPDEADGADALGGRFSTDVIIDHCSISWSTDECCSFYANTNFTMQWCLVTESLRESLHSKGTHVYGAIWGGLGASFYHNMLAHHGSRTPRFGTGDHKDRPDLHMVDMLNCVNYNYAGNGCYGAEGMHINLVNNYYKWGPATETASCRNKLISPGYATHSDGVTAIWSKYYLDGNVVTGNSNVTADNWLGVSFKGNSSMENGMVTDADQKSDTAMGQIPEFHQHTADMAYDKVLRYAFNDFDELKVNGTTGDRESFLMLWPNMKRAADRIKKQVELLGNKEYPLTFDGSENSYDAGGNPDPYNANISAVAYRIMAELLAETGESDKADRLAGTEVKDGIITSCNNFDYILFANVDFGKGGTSAVAIRVNSKYEGSELVVALDDNSGAAVASCKLPCTGSEWRETEIPVAKIKDTHNVVLRFFGSHPDNLMDIDYIKFK